MSSRRSSRLSSSSSSSNDENVLPLIAAANKEQRLNGATVAANKPGMLVEKSMHDANKKTHKGTGREARSTKRAKLEFDNGSSVSDTLFQQVQPSSQTLIELDADGSQNAVASDDEVVDRNLRQQAASPCSADGLGDDCADCNVAASPSPEPAEDSGSTFTAESGDNTAVGEQKSDDKATACEDIADDDEEHEEAPDQLSEAEYKSKYARLNNLLDQTELYSQFLSNKMSSRYAFNEDAQRSEATKKGAKKAGEKRKRGGPKSQKDSDGGQSVADINKRYQHDTKSSVSNSALQSLVPKGLALRDYQIEGVDWLISLYENGLNGILADEMGLGKTIQLILFLCHLTRHGVLGPFIVVTPLSTLHGWESELQRWAPQCEVLVYHGAREHRQALWSALPSPYNNRDFPVIVTSFEIALHDRRILNKIRWKQLIVDEGHRLKNMNSKLLIELKQFQTEGRLLLSGTPLQNSLRELWSLLNFVLPTVFDDLHRFESWFEFDESITSAEGQAQIVASEREHRLVSKLHTILRPFVLRRLKNEVLPDLPQKREFLIYTPLTGLQERYYSAILSHSLSAVTSQRGISLNNMLMQLRKVVNHPYLLHEPGEDDAIEQTGGVRVDLEAEVDDSEEEEVVEEYIDEEPAEVLPSKQRSSRSRNDKSSGSSTKKTTATAKGLRKERRAVGAATTEALIRDCGKLLFVDKLVRELHACGHKVLIFSQMTRMLDILEDWLILRGHVPGSSYCRIDGMTKSDDRVSQMELFQRDPKCNVFLLSTRAGGLGINLTAADSVIIYDSDWNPTRDMQAMDRCHRIGQTRTVHVYRLLTPSSIEVKLLDKAIVKRKLQLVVMQRGRMRRKDEDGKTINASGSMSKVEEVVQELIYIFNQKTLPDLALEGAARYGQQGQESSMDSRRKFKGRKTKKNEENVLSDHIIRMIADRDIKDEELRALDVDHSDALLHGEATFKDVTDDVNFRAVLDLNADGQPEIEGVGKNLFG